MSAAFPRAEYYGGSVPAGSFDPRMVYPRREVIPAGSPVAPNDFALWP
jgi:hypothetical protein